MMTSKCRCVVYPTPPNQTTVFCPVTRNIIRISPRRGTMSPLSRNPASIDYETVVNMLTKGVSNHQVPYTWGWIDGPSGTFTQPLYRQLYKVFVRGTSVFNA